MMEVVDLSERQPHFCIADVKVVHVVPVSMVRNYVNGRAPLDDDLLRAIARDWMNSMEVTA